MDIKIHPDEADRDRKEQKENIMERQRILIVDDEEAIRQTLREYFESEGFEVLEAADGTSAIEIARRERFEVVLTDLKMPDIDGLQVVDEIGRIRPDAVALILTGYPSPETTARALKLGCRGYITKPINLRHLRYLIYWGLIQRNWERKDLRKLRSRSESQ